MASVWKRLGVRASSDASGRVGAFESDDVPYSTAPAALYHMPERTIAVGVTHTVFPGASPPPYCSEIVLELWRADGVLDATVAFADSDTVPQSTASIKVSKASGIKARIVIDGLSTALSPGAMILTVKSNSGTTYMRGYAAK